MLDLPPLLLAAATSVAGFLLLWPASLALRDSSLADLWWGPGFGAAACAAWLAGDGTGAAGGLALALVCAWSLRMGWTLGRRRLREGKEDPRYAAIRAQHGARWPLRSLGQVFVLQGALQFALVAPVAFAAAGGGGEGGGAAAWIGAALALLGMGLETAADVQLDRWKAAGGRGILRGGLRAFVRHPNYSGEILFWTGVALVLASGGLWWAAATPILLGLLLARVSGRPLIEERLAARPGWDAYAARTPAFVPRAQDLRAALRRGAPGGRAHQ
ncbi:DUF1295 domain-containing protein [Rhodovulum sp. DZ06]|uniref:DUF1295 domain-containing protein n=1 Tax=Rhodovulum sp. DZ06 TaxID=3425126 RepID=UPI003D3590F8